MSVSRMLCSCIALLAIASTAPLAGERDPDLANDGANARFLLVFESDALGGDTDIVGRLLDLSGAQIGADIAIAVDAAVLAQAPRVAWNALASRFYVVWQETGATGTPSVVGRFVDGATGDLGSRLVISSVGEEPDVGGDSTGLRDQVMVAYKKGSTIRSTALHFVGSPPAVVPGTTIQVHGLTDDGPEISKDAGPGGRYLVVLRVNEIFDSKYVHVRALNADGSSASSVVTTRLGGDVLEPLEDFDAAGDGSRWQVIFANRPFGARAEEIECMECVIDPTLPKGLSATFPVRVAGDGVALHARDATIAEVPGGYLLGYSLDEDGRARLAALDAFACAACGDETIVGGDTASDIVVASGFPADPALGSSGLAVVHRFDRGSGADVLDVVAIAGELGARTDLGGGCGAGGVLSAGCAHVGNASFSVKVDGAAASAVSLFVFADADVPFACGECTLHPSLVSSGLTLLASATDGNGVAQFSLPIPNDMSLAGFTGIVQVATRSVGGTCFGFDLSNALSIVLDD